LPMGAPFPATRNFRWLFGLCKAMSSTQISRCSLWVHMT
jgi:hypothetical protein